MSFAALPAEERPRERLQDLGAESLSTPELLALQLRSGTSGSSAADLGTRVLAEFGSLQRVARAGVAELTCIAGIGEAKAASIVAGFELARRAQQSQDEPARVKRASDVAVVAMSRIGHCRRERVLVFVLNLRGRLIATEQLSLGTDRHSVVSVREVLNAVLRNDGAAFALAHNHPTGDLTASDADVQVTRAVAVGARAVGLRFLGHIVVNETEWVQIKKD